MHILALMSAAPLQVLAHGAYGLFIAMSLISLPIAAVVLLIQGLSLYFARKRWARMTWGVLTLLVGLASLAWQVFAAGLELSGSGVDLMSDMKLASALALLSVVLHLVSLGLSARLLMPRFDRPHT